MLSSGTFGQSEMTRHLRSQIDKIIRFDTEIDLREIPGFIIGIVDGDSTYVLPYGIRQRSGDQPLTPQDRFEIGGLTKVFSAMLMVELDAAAILPLDTPVLDLLAPQWHTPSLTGITVRSLLNHTSGLPKYPPMFGDTQEAVQNPYGHLDQADLLASLKEVRSGDHGRFRYSHYNYALLEPILTRLTGKAYGTLLARFVLSPLALHATSIDTAGLAPGHDLSGRRAQPWTFASFGPSEGLKSNLADLLRFVRYFLTLEEGAGVLQSDHDPVRVNKRLSMGLAWYLVDQRRAPRIHAHSGHTDGHYAFVAMVRQTGTGVVVLANSAAGVEDLGFLILRMINHNWRRK